MSTASAHFEHGDTNGDHATSAVVAIDMGYGHLRAAYAVADELGTRVLEMDRAPLGTVKDERLWAKVRAFHERVSRMSQVAVVGRPLRSLLEMATSIPPLYPYRDLSGTTLAAATLADRIQKGLGSELIRYLETTKGPLVSTFYASGIIADYHGYEPNIVIVTDTDINRVWAPANPSRTRIRYCVPCQRAARRLRAYGVPEDRIVFTGFPLPGELLGGPSLAVLRKNLAARLVRLDPTGSFRDQHRHEIDNFLGALPESPPNAPLLTFAIGGAGAQVNLVEQFLPGLRHAIAAGRLRLALVAGTRRNTVDKFESLLQKADLASELGGAVQILAETDFPSYYRRFNALLAETDILWTKPSELSFYAALGIPQIVSWPVGAHEKYNRRWLVENGAGIKQRNARSAGEWLIDALRDGTLAAAAWAGFVRLPKFGLYAALEVINGVDASPATPHPPPARFCD
jgi:hypothetical protein